MTDAQQRDFYSRILLGIVLAGGQDSLLALKVLIQWEFERLMDDC